MTSTHGTLRRTARKTETHKTLNRKLRRTCILKYTCGVCGYEYDEAAGDPDNGIAPGTKWEDLPDDFVCPVCGVGKDEFSED